MGFIRTNRCFGYMDLKTGAIVWGHLIIIYNFNKLLDYLIFWHTSKWQPFAEMGEMEMRFLVSRMYRLNNAFFKVLSLFFINSFYPMSGPNYE